METYGIKVSTFWFVVWHFYLITVFGFRSTQQRRPFKLELRVQQFIALWRALLTSESHSFTKTPPLFSISYTRISVHTTQRERESHTQPTKPINNKYLFSSQLSSLSLCEAFFSVSFFGQFIWEEPTCCTLYSNPYSIRISMFLDLGIQYFTLRS